MTAARRPRVRYAGMMQYDGDLQIPKSYLVSPPAISRTMGELLCRAGVRQLAISETQKFGHVTISSTATAPANLTKPWKNAWKFHPTAFLLNSGPG